jgi:hypothetical protein
MVLQELRRGRMVPVHLLFGVLAGAVSALWGWMAGQPIWAVVGLYVLGGILGLAASMAVMLRPRGSVAARTMEAALRTRFSKECPSHTEEAVRVSVVKHPQRAPGQDPSGG